MKLRTILASLAAVLAGCVQVHAPDTPRTTVQGTPGQAAPARPAEPAASSAQAVPAAPAAPAAQAEPAAEPDLTPLTLGSANQARDSLILEMQQAFRQGNRARLAQLLPQAQGHALEPWAAYWELRARLDVAGNSEVQQFFTRYAGTYQEDRLRNDWLLMLGQRRDWEAFAQEYPKFRMKDDREVTCYALLVQSLQEGSNTSPAVVDEVRRLWLAQREADDGCTIAASRLIGLNFGSKRMTAADAWRKARQSIEANRPRAAAGAIEIVAPEALAVLNELNSSPSKFLTSKVVAASRVRREMIGLALIKLATTDVESAASQLENKWGPQMPPEERDWIWGVIGRQATQRLMPEAASYFGRITKHEHLSDELLGWKVRSALRAGRTPDWKAMQQAIDGMTKEGESDPTWVYWKARALLDTGQSEGHRAEAQKLLESIASPKGFYEQLALEELGQKVVVPAKPAPLTTAEKRAARRDPGLNRALYAIQIGLRSEGNREWNYTTNLHRTGGLSDRELMAAAQFACDRQVWDRCINTSERMKTEFNFEQRFPTPFRDSVVRRSKEINLDPAYVYGLIRQESRFVMDARSTVGASGLMQVMPATARWTAGKLGMRGFQVEQLNDRDTNIAIGTGYLKLVLDDFAGSLPMAAAAYNAGPSRPRAWRNGPVMEGAAWAETIPFQETRDYVKKVVSNTTFYAAMLTGQPQSLKARMGTIGPRESAQAEPNREIP